MKKEHRNAVLKRLMIGYSIKEERDAQKKARLEREAALTDQAITPTAISFYFEDEEIIRTKRRYTKRKPLVTDLKI